MNLFPTQGNDGASGWQDHERDCSKTEREVTGVGMHGMEFTAERRRWTSRLKTNETQ